MAVLWVCEMDLRRFEALFGGVLAASKHMRTRAHTHMHTHVYAHVRVLGQGRSTA